MKQGFTSCPKAMKELKEKLKSLAIPVHQAIKVFEHGYCYISVNIKKNKPNSDLVLHLCKNLLITISMQSLYLIKKKELDRLTLKE